MSKSKIKIKTGDGKTVTVDKSIGKISKKLSEAKTEFYFENVSERAALRIVEFYDIQLGFTEEQRVKFGDPSTYKDKILKKRLKESDPDKEIVELYKEYKRLPPSEFFEFMKAAWDMEVESVIEVCAYITANMINGKSINMIERMLIKSEKK